jgi:hypothetical protein
MRRMRVLVAAALLVAMIPVGGASAKDRELALAVGESKTWNGVTATGANVNYHGLFDTRPHGINQLRPGACGKEVEDYCDVTLVAFSNPIPEDSNQTSRQRAARFVIDSYTTPGDYDLQVYESDAKGTRLAKAHGDTQGGCPCIDNGNYTGLYEEVEFSVRTTKAEPVKYYLVEVVYFANVQSSYKGTVTF